MNAHCSCTLAAIAALLGLSSAQPSTITVTVPDYVVERVGDVDEVTIPGGRLLVDEDGTPVVPYYIKSISIPRGRRVRSIELEGLSGVKQESGLRLPIVQPDYGPAAAPVSGPYPADEFAWSESDVEGTRKLHLLLYAVTYDPKTTELTFHKDYQFEVTYGPGDMRISRVAPGQAAYEPGDKATVTAHVEKQGDAQAVKAILRVTRQVGASPGEEVVALEHRLEAPGSVAFEWSTSDVGTGTFDVEVVVCDTEGNELDRSGTVVQIGLPLGEVTSFDVSPSHFRIGDDITMKLDFRNIGSADLLGDCVFRIRKAGELVDEMHVDMKTTKPGGTRTFKEKWSTDGAEKSAVYTAVGFVRYEGTACEPARATFSTNRMPEVVLKVLPDTVVVGDEASFDASGSADADGEIVEYGWKFGDGGTGTGVKAAHAWMQPGEFTVRLTAVDNEGGTGTAEQTVVVTEEQ
jgi:hypothetical protein